MHIGHLIRIMLDRNVRRAVNVYGLPFDGPLGYRVIALYYVGFFFILKQISPTNLPL